MALDTQVVWPSLAPAGDRAGKAPVQLARALVLIGSESYNHVTIASSTVSRSHAIFLNGDGGTYVRDLNSRSGLFVNSQRVRDAWLNDGDQIQIGRYSFTFRAGELPEREVDAPAAQLRLSGFVLPLKERVAVIGRREGCDLTIDNDQTSTVHAIIFEMNGKRFVRDLNSKNGTRLNGQKVRQVELQPGDVLRIAGTEIKYSVGASAAAGRTDHRAAAVAAPVPAKPRTQDLEDLLPPAAAMAATTTAAASTAPPAADDDLDIDALLAGEPAALAPEAPSASESEPGAPPVPAATPDMYKTASDQLQVKDADLIPADSAAGEDLALEILEPEKPAEPIAGPPVLPTAGSLPPSSSDEPESERVPLDLESLADEAVPLEEPVEVAQDEPVTSATAIPSEVSATDDAMPLEVEQDDTVSMTAPVGEEPDAISQAEEAIVDAPPPPIPVGPIDDFEQAKTPEAESEVAEPEATGDRVELAREPLGLPAAADEGTPEVSDDLEEARPPRLPETPEEAPTPEPAYTDAELAAARGARPEEPQSAVSVAEVVETDPVAARGHPAAASWYRPEPAATFDLTEEAVASAHASTADMGASSVAAQGTAGATAATFHPFDADEPIDARYVEALADESFLDDPVEEAGAEAQTQEDQAALLVMEEERAEPAGAEAEKIDDEVIEETPVEVAVHEETAALDDEPPRAVEELTSDTRRPGGFEFTQPPVTAAVPPPPAPAPQPVFVPLKAAATAKPAEVFVMTVAGGLTAVKAPVAPPGVTPIMLASKLPPPGAMAPQRSAPSAPPAAPTPAPAAAPQTPLVEDDVDTTMTEPPVQGSATVGELSRGIDEDDVEVTEGAAQVDLDEPLVGRAEPDVDEALGLLGDDRAGGGGASTDEAPGAAEGPGAITMSDQWSVAPEELGAGASVETDDEPLTVGADDAGVEEAFSAERLRGADAAVSDFDTAAEDLPAGEADENRRRLREQIIEPVEDDAAAPIDIFSLHADMPTPASETSAAALETSGLPQPQRPVLPAAQGRGRPPVRAVVPPRPEKWGPLAGAMIEPPEREFKPHEAAAAPRKRIAKLLVLMLIAMVAAALAVWKFVLPHVLVEATIQFDRLAEVDPADRDVFQDDQVGLLRSKQVHGAAVALLQSDEPSPPAGFLGDTESLWQQLKHRWVLRDGSKMALVVSYAGNDPEHDARRLSALLEAVYQAEPNQSRLRAANQRQRGIALKRDAMVHAENEVRNLRDRKQRLQELGNRRPEQAELTLLRQAVDRLDAELTTKVAARKGLQAELAQLQQALTQSPGEASAAAEKSDSGLAALVGELDGKRKRLDEVRNSIGSKATHARRELADAVDQFQVNLKAMQETMKDNPALKDYIESAQRLHEAAWKFQGDLIERQEKQQQRLVEYKRRLEEQLERRRQELLEKDPDLREYSQMLDLKTREHSAAEQSGLKKEAAKLKEQVDYVKQQIEGRKLAVGQDPFYSNAIDELKGIIETVEKQLASDRAESEKKMAELETGFRLRGPEIERLPDAQRAMAARLAERAASIQAARKAYADATAERDVDANEELKRLQTEVAALEGKVAVRRQELLASHRRQMNDQQKSDVEAKQQAVREAEKAELVALQAYSTKVKELEQATARHRDWQASAHELERMQQQDLPAAEARYREAEKELAQAQSDMRSVVTPLNPSKAEIVGGVKDRRGIYMAGAVIGIAMVFAALMLLTSGPGNPRPQPAVIDVGGVAKSPDEPVNV